MTPYDEFKDKLIDIKYTFHPIFHIPSQVSFDQCLMRCKEDHEDQWKLMEESSTSKDRDYHSTTHGINFNSPLNSLKFYHVTNFGLPPDPMHDLLEGYANLIVKLLLKTFICEDKYFTLSTLNTAIDSCIYGNATKPNHITDKDLNTDGKLSQTGMLFILFY